MIRALREASYFHQGIIGPTIAGIGGEAVGLLTDLLADRDEALRWEAVRAPGLIGPRAEKAAPRLKVALGFEDGKIRQVAASALWRISNDRVAIAALAVCLDDNREFVRMSAAEDLAGAGVPAAPAIPNLIEAFDDELATDRPELAAAIRSIRVASSLPEATAPRSR